MAEKFVPTQKYKMGKNNEFEFDEQGNKIAIDLYKGTEFDEVVDFLENKGTEKDRKEFKNNCYLVAKKIATGKNDKKGKPIYEVVKDDKGNIVMEKTTRMNWLYAKRKFFEKFAPEYITGKKKESKASRIANW